MTRAYDLGKEHAHLYFEEHGDVPDSPPPSFQRSYKVTDEYVNVSLILDVYPWYDGECLTGASVCYQETSSRAQREDGLSAAEVERLREYDFGVTDSALVAANDYEDGWKAEAALQHESQLLFFLNQKAL